MPGEPGSVRYRSTVTQVGPMVTEFLGSGMLILFAEGAPAELHDFCLLHRPDVTVGGVSPGDVLRLDDHELEIIAVGDRADENLRTLGHISVKFIEGGEAPLPGDVCVRVTTITEPTVGTQIFIVASASATTEGVT